MYFLHKYPQNVWVNQILSIVKSKTIKLPDNAVYFDAPCGNGIIGNLLFKELKNIKIELLDNDPVLIQSNYTEIQDPNFKVRVGDIFENSPAGNDNIWLLINSLYCLPKSDELIESKKDSMKYIIGVFPDIDSKNFKFFKKKNPDFENPSLLDLDSTIQLFENHNYNLIYKKDIIKIPFHIWNNKLQNLPIPLKIKNLIFSLFDKVFFFLPNQYTIIAFIRK
jgi:hypothetical protein